MAKRKRDSSCVLMQNFYEARVPENISKEANLSTKEIISSLWMGRTPAKFMGSTFKQLWVSSIMHLPYVLNYILFYKELLRKSKRGAAIPHLNKEIFYSLIIGIPPYQEQMRIVNRINEIYCNSQDLF